jgi:uncharacterized protein (DUF4415 family)
MMKFSKNRPLTDEEKAEIQAMIVGDPDNPGITDAQIEQMRPFVDMFPALADSMKRSRGRPKFEEPKVVVTLLISAKTIDRFKALAGEDWPTLMSEQLDAW